MSGDLSDMSKLDLNSIGVAMDVTAVQAMMGSLKVATDIAKAIFDLKSNAEIQSKVIDIQRALLAAQSSALEATSAQFDLQERVRDLESQLKSFDDWDKQEQRYVLVCPWRGAAQVYALKLSHALGEEPHYLCTHCFHNRKRVILNPASKDGYVSMTCPACKSITSTGYRAISAPQYAEDAGLEG
jgi:phage FluMu protein Com